MTNDNQRERLVELIQASVNGCARNWAEVIADHLLANGVIVPPCKVGDTVYCVNKNEIVECIVREYSITSKGLDSLIISQKHKYTNCTFLHSKNLENLDKVKFTREEAEQALVNYGSSKNDVGRKNEDSN